MISPNSPLVLRIALKTIKLLVLNILLTALLIGLGHLIFWSLA